MAERDNDRGAPGASEDEWGGEGPGAEGGDGRGEDPVSALENSPGDRNDSGDWTVSEFSAPKPQPKAIDDFSEFSEPVPAPSSDASDEFAAAPVDAAPAAPEDAWTVSDFGASTRGESLGERTAPPSAEEAAAATHWSLPDYNVVSSGTDKTHSEEFEASLDDAATQAPDWGDDELSAVPADAVPPAEESSVWTVSEFADKPGDSAPGADQSTWTVSEFEASSGDSASADGESGDEFASEELAAPVFEPKMETAETGSPADDEAVAMDASERRGAANTQPPEKVGGWTIPAWGIGEGSGSTEPEDLAASPREAEAVALDAETTDGRWGEFPGADDPVRGEMVSAAGLTVDEQEAEFSDHAEEGRSDPTADSLPFSDDELAAIEAAGGMDSSAGISLQTMTSSGESPSQSNAGGDWAADFREFSEMPVEEAPALSEQAAEGSGALAAGDPVDFMEAPVEAPDEAPVSEAEDWGDVAEEPVVAAPAESAASAQVEEFEGSWGADEFAPSDSVDFSEFSEPAPSVPPPVENLAAQAGDVDFSEFGESPGEAGTAEAEPIVASEPAGEAEAWGDLPAEQGTDFSEFSEPVVATGAPTPPEPESAPEEDWGEEFAEAEGMSAAPVERHGAAADAGPADEFAEFSKPAPESVSPGEEDLAGPETISDVVAPESNATAGESEDWGDEFAVSDQPESAEPLAEAGPAEKWAAEEFSSGGAPEPVEEWAEEEVAAAPVPVEEAEEIDEDWGDLDEVPVQVVPGAPAPSGGREREVALPEPELPLSLSGYAALLDQQAAADAETARRAAADREARLAAGPSFQRTGDASADAQLAILFRELEDRMDKEIRASLLSRIAEVYTGKAMEVKPEAAQRLRRLARENLQQAREEAGESYVIARALRRLEESAGDAEAALRDALHEEALAANLGTAVQIDAVLAQGRLCEQVGRPDEAVRKYERVLSLESGNLRALRGLESALMRLGRWEALVDVLERQAQIISGDEEQAQVQYRLGQVLSRFLAEQNGGEEGVAAQVFVNKVIGCFHTAAGKSANPVPALSALRGIYERFGKWPEYIETTERLIEQTEQPAAKLHFLYRMARTNLERLGNTDAAIACFERMLEIDPSNLLALKALERLFAERENHGRHLEVLRREAEVLDDRKQKLVLYLKIGRLYEEVFDETDAAVECYSKALEIDNRNTYALQALGKLHARRKDWEKLAQVYAFEADAVEDVRKKVDYLVKQAELYVNIFDDPDAAIDILYRALSLDDTNLAIYRTLGRLLAQRKRWVDLIRLYEAEVTLTEDPRRLITIYMSMGELWQGDLDASEFKGVDPFEKAVACYYQVLEIDAAHTPALSMLGKLFAQRRDWQRLMEVYGLEVELAGATSEKVSLYVKMAEIQEDHARNWTEAIFYLRKALELDPHNGMALTAMARLCPRQEDWDDLLQVYVREAESSEDLAYSAALHQLMGQLWDDRFKIPEKANESFRRAASLLSGNLVALRSLEDNYEVVGEWEKLRETLLEDLSESEETSQKVVLLKRLAEISEMRLHDRRGAADFYERLVDQDPKNFDGLENLARLAVELGDHERQAQALTGLLEAATDAAYREQVQLALGRLLAEHRVLEGSTEKALDALRGVLERNPKHREALDTAARLLHERGEWTELAGILRQRLELDDEPAVRASLLRWLGRAVLAGGGTGAEAIDAFSQALEIEPADLASRIELARAARAAGEPELAVEALRTLAGEIRDPDRRRALQVELAGVLHEDLSRHDQAVQVLHSVLDEEIDHPGALAYLGKIAEDESNWEEAIKLVERRYSLTADEKERVPLLLELARLWDERKSDLERAAEACSRALAIDGDNVEALAHLGEIELRRRRPEAYCALGEREIRRLVNRGRDKNAERLHELHHRLATGYRGLGQNAYAREHLRRALELQPGDFVAMVALEELYDADGLWSDLAEVRAYRAGKTSEAEEKRDLYVSSAIIWREKASDADHLERSVAELSRALEAVPNDTDVLVELANTAEKAERYREAAETLEELADLLPEADRPPHLARAARLHETKVGNIERAADVYNEALEINPNLREAAEPLAEIYYQAKNWRLALPLYERLSSIAFGDYPRDEQARFLYQYGVVLENLGQDEQAARNYRGAVDRKENYFDPIDALSRLYERRRMWNELIEVLAKKEQALKVLGRENELFAVYHRLADVNERLRKPEDAIRWYERAVDSNPDFADGFESLAKLSGRLGRFEEAASAWRRAGEAARKAGEGERAAEDWFQSGELLLNQLEQTVEAARSFALALEANPSHKEALDRLARAQYRSGRLAEARESFDKLAASGAEGTTLADYLTHLGRIALDKDDDRDAAISLFERALEADSRFRATFESLGELYEKAQQWDKAVETYEKFISLVERENPKATAPLHAKLGDLLKDRLSKPQDAILSFRKATRLDPRLDHAHQQLAEIFESSREQFPEAVREHVALLESNPFRWESYHRLFHMYEETGAHDKAFCVAAALVATGQATDSETLHFNAQSQRNPAEPRRAFEMANAPTPGPQLWHPLATNGAAEMLQILGFAMGRLAPQSLESLGIAKGDKVAPDDQNTINQMLRKALLILGRPPCDVYWWRNKAGELSVLPTPRHPSVLVGPKLFEGVENPAARRFVLGRGLWPIADGSFALLAFEPQHAPHLIGLMGKALDEGFQAAGDPEQIKKEVKLISRELSRKQKKEAEPLLPKLKEAAGKIDPERWRRGIELTRDRFGLLFCNDLRAALTQVMVRATGNASLNCNTVTSWQTTFAKVVPVRELLRWSVSEEYFGLRNRLGLSILST